MLMILVLWCVAATAQQTSKATLDSNRALFGVLAAMNTCGYDEDVEAADPLRVQVRAEIARAVQKSDRAQIAVRDLCAFMRDHQQGSQARDLAQYVSLALHLGEPPAFTLTVKENELPPDAAYVLGVVPLLQRFYTAADLTSVWSRVQPKYEELVGRYHDAVSKMLLTTDIYLKNPISGYLGRRFVIYVEPMAAPGQINARVYGDNYYVVISPERGQISVDKIRHTYLHYVLDPLATKRPKRMAELEEILSAVKFAPLDESYKSDIGLLVTESLIRAIESRLNTAKGKESEAANKAAADRAAAQGFVLAPHFNNMLAAFEKDPASLQEAFPEWLYRIEPARERRRIEQMVFAEAATTPDLVQPARKKTNPLDEAERRLASGDVAFAREIAERVATDQAGDRGRAMFVLAQAASVSGDMNGAIGYFQQAIEHSKTPRVVAWSHVYMGRIRDIRGEREQAVEHYRAALEASKQFPTVPGAQTAAQKGIEAAYQLPANRPQAQAPAPDNQN